HGASGDPRSTSGQLQGGAGPRLGTALGAREGARRDDPVVPRPSGGHFVSAPEELRRRILDLVSEYAAQEWPPKPFVPGETPVPVSGRVFDADDLSHLIDASLDFWLTAGRFAAEFEKGLARFLGLRAVLLTNSGSSANLLALSSLTAPELEDRRLRPGDEVITVAAGFPTTINPILQNGLVPVFLDIELGSYNVVASRLEEAGRARTPAHLLAPTLGN